jgi:hypothetical protein
VSWNAGPPLLARRPEPARPAVSFSPPLFGGVFINIELDSSSLLYSSYITRSKLSSADTQSLVLYIRRIVIGATCGPSFTFFPTVQGSVLICSCCVSFWTSGKTDLLSYVSRPPSNVLACFHFSHARAYPRWQPEAAGVLMSLEARHPHSYCGVSRPLRLLIETLPIGNMVTATGIMRLLKIFRFISYPCRWSSSRSWRCAPLDFTRSLSAQVASVVYVCTSADRT